MTRPGFSGCRGRCGSRSELAGEASGAAERYNRGAQPEARRNDDRAEDVVSNVADPRFLLLLRRLGFVEGLSTLVLFFVAMPLKYAADRPEAVRIAGTIHGVLFTALAIAFVLAIGRVPLPPRTALLGIVCAVFPFGPFWFDRRLPKA
jgi:integral membrane protein